MPANTQSMIIHAGARAISYCCSGLPTCSLASVMIFAGGGAPRNGLATGGHGAVGVVSAMLGLSA